ncbi:MAG: ATP-binding protein [Rhodospirillaceae bacterium]|nr:ATP-binding protein [Rhodospirillaceae bacterium]
MTKVLDFSPTGIVISEAESGVILYLNPAMAKAFGVSAKRAIGQSTSRFFADQADRDKIRSELFTHGAVHRLAVRGMTAAGTEIRAAFSCRPIEYMGRASVVTWLEDETVHVRREQEILSASRQVELLRQVAGICNRAVNFFDALRKSSMEVARVLGWPIGLAYRLAHGDDQTLQIASFSFPKDRPDLESLRPVLISRSFRVGEDLPGRALAARQPLWIESVAAEPGLERFQHGEAGPVMAALAVPIVADDRVVAVLEFLTDQPAPRDDMMVLTLTQIGSELGRVHLRDLTTVALQEARAEAESNARAKASFLAAMSHEVRTPMNGVVGMVDLILQTKLDDDQRFMLQTVMDSGRALIKVINDILDFSKIEAGRLELERAAFSLVKTVEEAAFSLAPVATQKGLRVNTYVDPSIPDVVRGDAVRVRQILSNLVSNAIKFSERGEIAIKAELLPANGSPALRVRLSVRDEGVGISAEARGRLFEEFQQADTSTTRRFGGSGLGLAICQRLTKLMEGEIGVDSQLGVGSEFFCTLPFDIVDDQSTRHTERETLAGLRVLAIADSEILLRACRAYLSMWHAEVVTVPKLRDAAPHFQAARARIKPIDVIVIPHVDDPQAVASLRQGFIDDGQMPYPRFVIGRGRGVQNDILGKIREVTLLDVDPVRRAALVFAVAVAAGRASPEAPILEPPDFKTAATPPSVDQALAQRRLILVAEDNAANREVIRRQLNRLGFACEMAEDGVQALAMWRAKTYALLLTDCHMPKMDGFGLTAEIRKAESAKGGRAPIIAITANVLQGESERCIAAGMDDFLPKPVDLKTLRATLERWIAAPAEKDSNAERGETTKSKPTPVDPRVLDLSRIREAFGEIDDDARAYFEVYVDSVRPLIVQILDDIATARFSAAREAVHKAKGATANAGGQELAALLHDIEFALVEERHDDAAFRSREVQAAWSRLTRAIGLV